MSDNVREFKPKGVEMPSVFGLSMRYLAFVLLAVLLAGCRTGGMGGKAVSGVVNEEERFPVHDMGSGKWNARHVSISYRYMKDGGTFGISGAVSFSESVQNDFSSVRYFHVEVIFADARGNAIDSRGLMSSGQGGFDPIEFDKRVPVPDGAVFFAFAYSGELQATDRDMGSTGTAIWAYPVSRQ